MKCSIPGCQEHGLMEFSMLPVCLQHSGQLIKETDEYYGRKRKDRPLYAQIAPMIRHSRRYSKQGELMRIQKLAVRRRR